MWFGVQAGRGWRYTLTCITGVQASDCCVAVATDQGCADGFPRTRQAVRVAQQVQRLRIQARRGRGRRRVRGAQQLRHAAKVGCLVAHERLVQRLARGAARGLRCGRQASAAAERAANE